MAQSERKSGRGTGKGGGTPRGKTFSMEGPPPGMFTVQDHTRGYTNTPTVKHTHGRTVVWCEVFDLSRLKQF